MGLLLMPLLSVGMNAQQSKTDYYVAKSYEYAGITLPYRELGLNQEKGGQSALVIQLHGGTARGTDNVAQLEAAAVDSVERFLRDMGGKALFVLPQCAGDRVWNESSRTYAVTMTDVLAHWLADYIDQNNVDASRVYITGYSAGGSGAWRMVNDNQDMFAAACIAAANPVMVEAARVRNTPVYAIAGANDAIMDATKIENFVLQLLAGGGQARFDLLEDQDHFGTCNTAFTAARLAWMMEYPASTPIEGDLTGDGVVDIDDVSRLINIILGK